MRNFLIRLIINALALSAAAYLVTGITLAGDFWDVLLVALVFGIVNALLKPILIVLSLPFLLLTLGLFTFVVNGALLLLTASLTAHLDVAGLGAAILGSIVISIVSIVLGGVLKDEVKRG
ncbi:MAG TPA: phage holin family protein [Longimicrobiales bacterium]|nr:phage holin family protein [Longimicrobiales bacterium]